MDSQTETIDALDGFIATQRRLLARQRADIEHLQRLRNDLRERECSALSDLDKQLDHDSFRLSSQTDLRLTLPQKFDWNVFDKADITTLSTFATQVRQKRTALSKIQQSPLSELQVFVKTAKIEILDPILEQVAKSTLALQLESEDEEEEDNEICALERRRFEERAKILELKKRKIRGGGVAGGGFSSLTTRNVVFVRDDLEDETAEVDVDSWADGDKQQQRRMKKVLKIKTDMSSSVKRQRPTKVKANGKGSSYHDETMKKSSPTCAAEDEERPKKKAKLLSAPSPLVKKRFHSTTKPPASSDDDDGGGGGGEGEGEGEGGDEEEGEDGSNDAEELGLSTSCTAAAIPPSRKKPKSETYKQAWSVDEQNLLEQLLETIPDGEQYRWLKISRAMGGRRTPRQVASRVQKYFEKLKKFGVAVD